MDLYEAWVRQEAFKKNPNNLDMILEYMSDVKCMQTVDLINYGLANGGLTRETSLGEVKMEYESSGQGGRDTSIVNITFDNRHAKAIDPNGRTINFTNLCRTYVNNISQTLDVGYKRMQIVGKLRLDEKQELIHDLPLPIQSDISNGKLSLYNYTITPVVNWCDIQYIMHCIIRLAMSFQGLDRVKGWHLPRRGDPYFQIYQSDPQQCAYAKSRFNSLISQVFTTNDESTSNVDLLALTLRLNAELRNAARQVVAKCPT